MPHAAAASIHADAALPGVSLPPPSPFTTVEASCQNLLSLSATLSAAKPSRADGSGGELGIEIRHYTPEAKVQIEFDRAVRIQKIFGPSQLEAARVIAATTAANVTLVIFIATGPFHIEEGAVIPEDGGGALQEGPLLHRIFGGHRVQRPD